MHELIYTSAAKTLDGTGLGVVAKTENIPAEVESMMRRLSRFDFFDLPESKLTRFFVVSHVIVTVANDCWHVLTRTVLSGRETEFGNSRRQKFLTHHVAISDRELGGNRSIFQLLLAPDLFVDSWNSPPKVLAGRQLKVVKSLANKATAWTKCKIGEFGRDQWLEWTLDRKSPGFLLGNTSDEILDLFSAASLELGPMVNSISFVTALGADIQGVKFDWIGLIRESRFASSVGSNSTTRLLDTNRRHENFERSKSGATVKISNTSASTITNAGGTGKKHNDPFDSILESGLNPVAKIPSESQMSEFKGSAMRNTSARNASFTQLDEIPPPPTLHSKGSRRILVVSLAALLFLTLGSSAWFAYYTWNGLVTALAQEKENIALLKTAHNLAIKEISDKETKLGIANQEIDKQKQLNESNKIEFDNLAETVEAEKKTQAEEAERQLEVQKRTRINAIEALKQIPHQSRVSIPVSPSIKENIEYVWDFELFGGEIQCHFLNSNLMVESPRDQVNIDTGTKFLEFEDLSSGLLVQVEVLRDRKPEQLKLVVNCAGLKPSSPPLIQTMSLIIDGYSGLDDKSTPSKIKTLHVVFNPDSWPITSRNGISIQQSWYSNPKLGIHLAEVEAPVFERGARTAMKNLNMEVFFSELAKGGIIGGDSSEGRQESGSSKREADLSSKFSDIAAKLAVKGENGNETLVLELSSLPIQKVVPDEKGNKKNLVNNALHDPYDAMLKNAELSGWLFFEHNVGAEKIEFPFLFFGNPAELQVMNVDLIEDNPFSPSTWPKNPKGTGQ